MVTRAGKVVVTLTGLPGVQAHATETASPLELNVAVAPTEVPARTAEAIVELRPGSATPAIVEARRAPSLVAALTSWYCRCNCPNWIATYRIVASTGRNTASSAAD